MKPDLSPGKYVVAVSGGVDSVSLLNMLTKLPKLELIVAHYDHGIRPDSALDRQLTKALAKKYGLAFEYARGQLGPKTSEAKARTKRYEFLEAVKAKYQAQAIVTAHHQDDLLETAIINWLRGSGRRGLSSLKSTPAIKRPLLNMNKKQLVDYAIAHNLTWHEDSTNQDETYLRNWIRRQIMPKLDSRQRTRLLKMIEQTTEINQVIELSIGQLLTLKLDKNGLDRTWFRQLPHAVAKEIMASWLRQNGLQFDRQTIERLVVASKTYRDGKVADINRGLRLTIGPKYLALTKRER